MDRHAATESLIQEAITSVRRHILLCGFVFMLLISAVVGVMLFYPRLYGSEGKLFVQLGRSVASLDPSSSTGQTVNVQETRETEIRSIAEILEGRQMAEKLVDEIGVERILDDGWPEWLTIPALPSLSLEEEEAEVTETDSVEPRLTASELEAIKRRELAVNRVMSRLEITPGQRNTVISISAKAQTPYLARDIVETLMELYRVEHVRVHRTEGSLEFFNNRVTTEQANVKTAEEAIRQFKIDNNLVTIDGERALLQQRIDRAELGLVDTTAEMAASQARRSKLTELINSYDETEIATVTRGSESAASASGRSRLYELQVEYSRQRALLTADHPRLKVLEEEIRLAKEELSDVEETVISETSETNERRRALELALDQEEATLNGLVVREQAYRNDLEISHERLRLLAATEVRLAELERQRDVSVANLTEANIKRSQAEVNAGLDEVNIANLSVQPATLILKHVSPRGSIVLPLGAIAAAGIAVALAIYRERSCPLTSPREIVERQLDLPVLMSVPRVAPSVMDRVRLVALESDQRQETASQASVEVTRS